MSETLKLIHQAARELQIDVTAWTTIDGDKTEHRATFKRNNGDPGHMTIKDGASYPDIHAAMKAEYKGKTEETIK